MRKMTSILLVILLMFQMVCFAAAEEPEKTPEPSAAEEETRAEPVREEAVPALQDVKDETEDVGEVHDWEAVWTWKDTSEASVRLVCSECGETIEDQKASLAFSKEWNDGTSRHDLVYTAAAVVDGQTYTDRKIVPIKETWEGIYDSLAAFSAPVNMDSYRWQYSTNGGETWDNCHSNFNSYTYLTSRLTTGMDGWLYRCVMTKNGEEIIQNAIELSVIGIAEQPVDQTVTEGRKAIFEVKTTGTDLSYQWQVSKDGGTTWKNCTSAGNNTSSFSFTAKMSYSGWQYRCVVTKYSTEMQSLPATLTVQADVPAPVITTQPQAQTVEAGSRATFTVGAAGSGLSYQWQVNKSGTWNDCTSAGSDAATFSFTTKTSYSGWKYRCIVSNTGGSVTSGAVTLTVPAAAKPTITTQPKAKTVLTGKTATFTISASGSGLSYQWQVSKDGGTTWKNCTSAGYNTNKLSFTAKVSYSGWMYRCKVSNSGGSITSKAAELTVTTVLIKTQPKAVKVTEGRTATFSVVATGNSISYRWQVSKDGGTTWKNCTSTGYNTDTLTFATAIGYSGWQYRCVVSNSGGKAYSDAAQLTVRAADGYTLSTAYTLQTEKAYTKTWTADDSGKNCYNLFSIPERGYIYFSIAKPKYNGKVVSFGLTITDQNTGEVVWKTNTSPQAGSDSTAYEYYIGLAEGEYRINIKPGTKISTGSFKAKYKYVFNASLNYEVESNDTFDNATYLPVRRAIAGVITEESLSPNKDIYRTYLLDGTYYSLLISDYASLTDKSVQITFYNENLNVVNIIDDAVVYEGTNVILRLKPHSSGYYYLQLSGDGNDAGVMYGLYLDYIF